MFSSSNLTVLHLQNLSWTTRFSEVVVLLSTASWNNGSCVSIWHYHVSGECSAGSAWCTVQYTMLRKNIKMTGRPNWLQSSTCLFILWKKKYSWNKRSCFWYRPILWKQKFAFFSRPNQAIMQPFTGQQVRENNFCMFSSLTKINSMQIFSFYNILSWWALQNHKVY